jgi:hypothetical protein
MQKQYVGVGVLVLVVVVAGWYFVGSKEPKAAPVVTPAPGSLLPDSEPTATTLTDTKSFESTPERIKRERLERQVKVNEIGLTFSDQELENWTSFSNKDLLSFKYPTVFTETHKEYDAALDNPPIFIQSINYEDRGMQMVITVRENDETDIEKKYEELRATYETPSEYEGHLISWKVVAHDFIEINGTQGVRYEFNSGYPAYDVNYVFLSNSKEYHVGLRLPLPERFPDNLTEEEIDLIKKDQINLFDQIVSTMEFPSR